MRSEIQEISFTLKETDLYRIHQSGDLVNLDALDSSSLKLLPSLLILRDALYSSGFRNYLSEVTQAGPLSGKKTDMAVNVYKPGCHLLCHDDVIGSRRVSYILYLTDPDKPWKEEWGGALRLYPTSHPVARNQSNLIAEDRSKLIAEDQPDPGAEDEPKPAAQDPSNQIAEDRPKPNAEDQSNPIAKDQTNLIAEDKSNPIAEGRLDSRAEYQSKSVAKDQSNELAEDRSTPLAEDQSDSIIEDQSNPIAEGQFKSTAEDQSGSTAEDQSKPLAKEQSNPIAEDRSKHITEDQSNLIVEDQSNLIVEDQSDPIAEDQDVKVPLPDPTVSIPPAFNQLSFFAVQPGESFHDVEEVFASDDKTEDEARVRMAISGWYHIPQEGEDGFIEGLETTLAEKSSLTQLQSKEDAYDLPSATKTRPIDVDTSFDSSTDPNDEKSLVIDPMFSEDDMNFLLKYIQPKYLIPDILEPAAAFFTDQCFLALPGFLSQKFSDSLRNYIVVQESQVLPATTTEIETTTPWTVARPPHKHRYLFLQSGCKKTIQNQSPLQDLLENLFPSVPFHKWLQRATGQVISTHNLLARRFRRGKDYTVATGYDEEDPQVEITLAITPSSGWEAEGPATDQSETKGPTGPAKEHTGSDQAHNGHDERDKVDDGAQTIGDESYTAGETDHEMDHYRPTGGDVGGYVTYLVNDEDDGMDVEGAAPTEGQAKRPKSDPAVYQTAGEDDDELVLAQMPAAWNRLDIVCRDRGTMRYVKYVSQSAPGDRWDICGEFSVVLPNNDQEEEEGGEETQQGGADGSTALHSIFAEDTDETEMKSESETSDDY